jgi:hypothetical protein
MLRETTCGEREVEIRRWLRREKRGRVHREKWELRERLRFRGCVKKP